MSSESVDAGCRTVTHNIRGGEIFDLLHVCPEISNSLRVYKIEGIDVTYSHRGNTLTSANVLVHSKNWDNPSRSFIFRFNLNLNPNNSIYEVSFGDSDDDTTREISDRFIPDLINIARYFEEGFIYINSIEFRLGIVDYLKNLIKSRKIVVSNAHAIITEENHMEYFSYSDGGLSLKICNSEGKALYYIDYIPVKDGGTDVVRVCYLEGGCTLRWIEIVYVNDS